MLPSYTSVGMQRLLSARLKAGVRAPTWAVALHVLGRETGLTNPGLGRPRSGLAELQEREKTIVSSLLVTCIRDVGRY